ncbi:MAG: AbrB/MazE/SpoVT family DNA-binding domain-containing protein [Acutalibacteraceae bacterium]
MEKRTRRTGIVDCVGRVIIPKRYREICGIEDGTKVDFSIENGNIVIRKSVPGCVMCGNKDDLVEIDDRYVCINCITLIKNL